MGPFADDLERRRYRGLGLSDARRDVLLGGSILRHEMKARMHAGRNVFFRIHRTERELRGFDLGKLGACDSVVRVNGRPNVRWRRNHRPHVKARAFGDLLQGLSVGRVLHRDVQSIAQATHTPHVDRDDTIALDDLERDQLEELPREIDVVKRDPRNTELLAQNLRDLRLRNEPAFDQQRAETSTDALLLGERFLELLSRDEPGSHQKLAEPDPRSFHSRRRKYRLMA